MPVLAATNIRHSYGDRVILDGVSLSVEDGERIGVVGRNGGGKTTFMRTLIGALKPDVGDVSIQRGKRIGYLAQEMGLDSSRTVIEEARSAFAEVERLHDQLERVHHDMGDASGDALQKLLKRQADLEHRIEAAGGYNTEHRAGAVLHGLGFTDAQFGIAVGGLSGGQKSRLALAKVLLEGPDVLLLDEPTNHLDIDGRVWLEGFLNDEFGGAVILISHDRRLLDHVVHRIVEVERGRLIDYPGNYAKFRELRAERRESQMRAWEKEQTRFKREEAFIRKYKAGQRAKQARGREARLDREKEGSELERPLELDAFRFELPKAERTGDLVVVARGLSKAYTSEDGKTRTLFDDLDVTIGRGERWGVIGPNGAGKTTLVRCMLGELEPDAGSSKLGSRVVTGYFTQTRVDMRDDLTVVRYLQKRIRDDNDGLLMSEQQARDLAGAFLFSGRDQEKELGVMSGGERTRAALAALLASAKNLLVLDEPTNHLDIPSAERLEVALAGEAGFEGTLILISHDRALIDATCDRLLVLDGKGGCRVFLGNYTEWVESELGAIGPAAQVREGNAPTAPLGSAPRSRDALSGGRHGDAGAEPKPKARAKSKFSWMRDEQVEAKVEELEASLARVDAALGEPEVWTDAIRAAQLNDQRAELKRELDEIEEEWLRRME